MGSREESSPCSHEFIPVGSEDSHLSAGLPVYSWLDAGYSFRSTDYAE
jgi:hypothetical protein